MESLKTFIKTVRAILIARLREFYRDKAALYWHLILPCFIITSFYFIFDSNQTPTYKVGVVGAENIHHSSESGDLFRNIKKPLFSKKPQSEEFFQLKYVQFIPQEKQEAALDKIRSHTLDMLVQPGNPLQYWINDSNKKAYFLEKILKGSYHKPIQKNPSLDRAVSYVDWVFPGILALNILFSCLWGVGWLIVKYRDDGYLKRLNATPLKVYHFILGQMLARLIIIFFGTSVILIVGSWLIDFDQQGSYLDLFICYFFGGLSLISIGLLVAARTTSKEFADGALNLFSWPMIIFSGMWFSLEGAPSWLLAIAYSLPLTHLVESTRKIMLEGAVLSELWFNVSSMMIFSGVAFVLVAVFFKWNDR